MSRLFLWPTQFPVPMGAKGSFPGDKGDWVWGGPPMVPLIFFYSCLDLLLHWAENFYTTWRLCVTLKVFCNRHNKDLYNENWKIPSVLEHFSLAGTVLTTHLQVVPWLWMGVAMPPLRPICLHCMCRDTFTLHASEVLLLASFLQKCNMWHKT
jgi:hypothetical protein